MYVCLDGKFVPALEAKVSVFDHGFLYGDGVYDTTRTYDGQVWQLDEHLRRLRKSAAQVQLPVPWSDKELAEWTRELVRMNGFAKSGEAKSDGGASQVGAVGEGGAKGAEARIRLMVTRGENHFKFSEVKKPSLVIFAEELVPEPTEVYEQGVSIITIPITRILPEAKTTSLLPMILARLVGERERAYETVFADGDGQLTEGSISNLFIVKDDIVKTPGRELLFGLARAAVIDVAREHYAVEEEVVKLDDLYEADECFLTNSVRGVVPVVAADGRGIGSGQVGDVTRLLMDGFERAVRGRG